MPQADPRDTTPQGDPDTVVLLQTGCWVGLHIRGVPGQVLLEIWEDTQGQPVSCAVTRGVYVTDSSAHSNLWRLNTEQHGG